MTKICDAENSSDDKVFNYPQCYYLHKDSRIIDILI